MSETDSDSDPAPKLLQNAAYCKDCDRIIVSTHIHDYVACKHGFRDGGLMYIRGGGNLQDLSVCTNDSREKIKNTLVWGTYGKNGDEPLKRKFLKDLETSHLQAILKTQGHIHSLRKQAIVDILTDRGVNLRI